MPCVAASLCNYDATNSGDIGTAALPLPSLPLCSLPFPSFPFTALCFTSLQVTSLPSLCFIHFHYLTFLSLHRFTSLLHFPHCASFSFIILFFLSRFLLAFACLPLIPFLCFIFPDLHFHSLPLFVSFPSTSLHFTLSLHLTSPFTSFSLLFLFPFSFPPLFSILFSTVNFTFSPSIPFSSRSLPLLPFLSFPFFFCFPFPWRSFPFLYSL